MGSKFEKFSINMRAQLIQLRNCEANQVGEPGTPVALNWRSVKASESGRKVRVKIFTHRVDRHSRRQPEREREIGNLVRSNGLESSTV